MLLADDISVGLLDTSPVAATSTTVITLKGSAVVPEPVTGVWLTGVNGV